MNRLKKVPKIKFHTSFEPNQSCAIANVDVKGISPEAIGKHLFAKDRIIVTPIMQEEFQSLRITPNVYTTVNELNRFCEQMELIARDGLPSRLKRKEAARL
jgi:isopenicillin-N epimerase